MRNHVSKDETDESVSSRMQQNKKILESEKNEESIVQLNQASMARQTLVELLKNSYLCRLRLQKERFKA